MENTKVNLAQIQDKLIRRGKAKKKTKSLFDTPLSERNYWGNDKGTELLMSWNRNAIRKSLNDGFLFDFDNEKFYLVLDSEKRKELIDYQLQLLADLQIDTSIQIVQNDEGKWLIQKG